MRLCSISTPGLAKRQPVVDEYLPMHTAPYVCLVMPEMCA